MLALIFAEVVDNAAHYIHDHLNRKRTAAVDIAFSPGQLTIANPILFGSGEAIRKRLEDARSTVGRSLNRVITLATLLKCEVDFSYPRGKQVLFICRFPK